MKSKNNISGHKIKGSLTIEAALVLPIFIFAMLAFIYLLQVAILHNNMQTAITEIGLDAGKYGYAYESFYDSNNDSTPEAMNNIARGIDSEYFKTALYGKLNVEAINKSIIKNGFSGINTYFSTYMDGNDEIDVIINYQIKIPLLFIKVDDIQIVQRVKLKSWNGYHPIPRFTKGTEGSDEEGETVFITETGTVYHTSRDCTHIRLSIHSVPFNQVKDLRNESGGKYKSCHRCGSQSENGANVYITVSGDRYHSNKNCSGLKRTVTEVPLSQVKDWNPCSRCGN